MAAALIYWFGPQHLFLDERVDEALPSAAAIDGGRGSNPGETGGHRSRIEDLDTSSGPDLRVYLSQAPADGSEDSLDDAFVDLGGLKGNQGDQNYGIPAGVGLDDFQSVAIWCRRFSAGFGVAPLGS
jgi:hypothetical protein